MSFDTKDIRKKGKDFTLNLTKRLKMVKND